MSDTNDPQEIERLRARLAELNAKQPSKSGWGFSGGFFGCFGVLAAIVTLVFVLVAMGQCSRSVVAPVTNNPPSSAIPPTPSSPDGQSQTSSAVASAWTYDEIADAMHDTKTKTACTTSTNEAQLSFPYHNTTAELCIRKGPRFGLDSYLALNGGGQILCGIESCTVRVRFDKGAVQSFSAAPPADNSTNVIFITNTSRLIAALRKSSVAVIELQFFEEGSQQLIFDTKGLKWP